VRAEAVQVDLDQVGVRGANAALLAQILLPVRPGRFVARAEEFDDGDNAIAARAVDDFEKGFARGVGLRIDHERLALGGAFSGIARGDREARQEGHSALKGTQLVVMGRKQVHQIAQDMGARNGLT
jgi:hypothetical protein